MARRQVAVRREEILDQTVEQVHAHGFEGVRVADVARALSISQALVFYHFETKDRLLAEALRLAVQRDLDRLDRALSRGTDATDRLRRLVRQYAPQGSARGWTVWVDAWSAALRTPELREALTQLDSRWRAALQGVVVDGVAAGEFTCADPAGSARRLMALMDGLAVQVTVQRGLSPRRMALWSRRAAEAELALPPGALDARPRQESQDAS